jgi:hypothetical protein
VGQRLGGAGQAQIVFGVKHGTAPDGGRRRNGTSGTGEAWICAASPSPASTENAGHPCKISSSANPPNRRMQRLIGGARGRSLCA